MVEGGAGGEQVREACVARAAKSELPVAGVGEEFQAGVVGEAEAEVSMESPYTNPMPAVDTGLAPSESEKTELPVAGVGEEVEVEVVGEAEAEATMAPGVAYTDPLPAVDTGLAPTESGKTPEQTVSMGACTEQEQPPPSSPSALKRAVDHSADSLLSPAGQPQDSSSDDAKRQRTQ